MNDYYTDILKIIFQNSKEYYKCPLKIIQIILDIDFR